MYKKLWTRRYQCLPLPKERARNISFHLTTIIHAAVDVLNKTEEFNSEFYCRVYYCLPKKKIIKIEI